MNTRRRLQGTVLRSKTPKTLIVEIKRSFQHPLYGKVVHISEHMMVHDEFNCNVGDQVRIIETKPVSRRKRWAVEAIINKQEVSEEPLELETSEVEE